MTARPLRLLPDLRFRRTTLLVCAIAALGLACQSQNGTDSAAQGGTAAPQASFAQDATSGTPGLTVQFSDTSSGGIDQYEWDFGPLGTRSEPNPVVTFADVGVYSVALTVTGERGSSTASKPALIAVAEMPVAAASCTPTSGFAPLTVSCTDGSQSASTISWDFGDGAVSSDANPTHTFVPPTPVPPATPAVTTYTVTQTVSNAAGSDTVDVQVEVIPLAITTDVPSGSGPSAAGVMLTAELGGQSAGTRWSVDGVIVGDENPQHVDLRTPGTYTIELSSIQLVPFLSGATSIQYEVAYGPATAAFSPDVSSGSGPLQVVFDDESLGSVDSWAWDFGDGSECVFPAPAVPDPIAPETVCDASSPTHVYDAIGSYDVTLTVTGPDADPTAPPVMSIAQRSDAVRVSILDASFEEQTTNSAIGGAWTPLRPDPEPVFAEHVALALGGGADAEMPSDGVKWAALEGLGTDGTVAVDDIENGLRQQFLLPLDQPVIELDYALLYAEPPASPVLDAFTATVSDGTTTVEIPSARADVSSPYAGGSLRYPTRDGSQVRATPRRTASLDVAAAFPSATVDTRFTLTLRVTNAANSSFRSPIAYVDHIRFSERATSLTSQFLLETAPVVAGVGAVFTDEACPDPDPDTGVCATPISWRWDFDFGDPRPVRPIPPDALGSSERSPVYVFPEAGVYEVRQQVRLADLESESFLTVTVIGGATADFELMSSPSAPAPAIFTFEDRSQEDPNDPIVDWSWNFGGWGPSSAQDPPDVTISQVGEWDILLTVTTASGQTDTAEMTVTVTPPIN